jgi:uncharacterized integral membrane protein
MLVVAVLLGIALVDFVVQNTRLVSVEFFSVSGRVPVAVALLVAALVGATIVLVVGVARIGQLRRRVRQLESNAASASSSDSGFEPASQEVAPEPDVA